MDEWSVEASTLISIILLLIMLFGMAGNILVAKATYQRHIRRLPGTLFIRNLACIDIGGSANLIFMLVTSICRGKWLFGKTGCEISGTMIVFFGKSSLHALWILSFNRYMKICQPAKYNKVFSSRGNVTLIALPWVAATFISIAPVMGWSSNEFQISKCVCHFKFSTNISYTITFLTLVALPVGIIAICYTQIYRTVRLHQMSFLQFRRSVGSGANIEDIRTTRAIFAIIMAFLLCYTPGSLVNILEMTGIIAPPWVDLVAITLIVSKHAQNPVFYGLLNRRYRNEFSRFLRPSLRCCKRRDRRDPISIKGSTWSLGDFERAEPGRVKDLALKSLHWKSTPDCGKADKCSNKQ